MSKKKRKSKNYDICGVVEVINITKGRRKTTLLDLDKKAIEPDLQFSGSIVEKSPIYKQDAPNTEQEEGLPSIGSRDEG
tara:strand:- start:1158 stop:1394 length:237 start_codon:yes stop_codon:yes gene_type:complete